VDHLRYGFGLLNRWSRGEDSFTDADYSASWSRNSVSVDEWAQRRTALRSEIFVWRESLTSPREVTQTVQLTTVLASIAHLAYHLGAIRQLNRVTGGPPAAD